MNFLILSEVNHPSMMSFLKKRGNVTWERGKIFDEDISQFDWIISYGYRHIISGYIIKSKKPNNQSPHFILALQSWCAS